MELQHVKPHGVLYQMADQDEAIAQAISEAVRASGQRLILIALARGGLSAHSRKMGCRVASEGFADRAYNSNGTLVPRKLPGALITQPEKAAAQAIQIVCEGKVTALDGMEVALDIDTICCHGDTPGATEIVRAVREGLEKAGVEVRALRGWL